MKYANYRFLSGIMIIILLTSACLPGCSISAEDSNTYAFIYKNTENQYGEKEMEGFKIAIEELGGNVRLLAPDEPTVEGQITFIKQMTRQKVRAIAVASNDYDALVPYLQDAMNKGIKVLSIDSAVHPDGRMLHVNQADNREIASVLIQSAYDMSDSSGTFAIVSTTPQMGNQNTWISYMAELLYEEPYRELTLVDIVYGEDELGKSKEVTEELLEKYSDLDVIIAPTVKGLQGAAQVLQEQNREDSIKVTGLGLPSLMYEYIEADVCPWMYLWSPIDVGYLTGYAARALAEDTITGAPDETFAAGSLGSFTIVPALDGGTEVILGEPQKYDAENIAEWKNVY